MKTALYRHFDASGRLLYVGMSVNPVQRLAQHYDSVWADEIARVDINYFSDRTTAAAAEREAILTEKPLHNIAGNPASAKYRSSASIMFSARVPLALFNAVNAAAAEDDLSRTDTIISLLESALIAREE